MPSFPSFNKEECKSIEIYSDDAQRLLAIYIQPSVVRLYEQLQAQQDLIEKIPPDRQVWSTLHDLCYKAAMNCEQKVEAGKYQVATLPIKDTKGQ